MIFLQSHDEWGDFDAGPHCGICLLVAMALSLAVTTELGWCAYRAIEMMVGGM